MNLFESKSIYNSGSSKFIEEFYINGNSVDCDEYYFYLEREKEVEDKKLKEVKNVENLKENPYEYDDTTDCKCETCDDYDNCCENGKCSCKDERCGECEEDEFDYGELLEVFARKIQTTKGDFESIKQILDEFADIFIPDYDEDDEICECEEENMIDENCKESECPGCSECIDCDDEGCENYISSEEIEELRLIADFTKEVLKRDGCPECVFELLGDLYIKGKNIGWENHKDYIQMCNEE